MKLLKKFFEPIYTYISYILFGWWYALFMSIRENTTEWIESYWYVLTHWNEPEEEVEPLINVESKTRKLRSRWSLELEEDLNAIHGINNANHRPPNLIRRNQQNNISMVDEYGDIDIPRINPHGQSLQERVRIEAHNNRRRLASDPWINQRGPSSSASSVSTSASSPPEPIEPGINFIPRYANGGLLFEDYHMHNNPCGEVIIGKNGKCPICDTINKNKKSDSEFLTKEDVEIC